MLPLEKTSRNLSRPTERLYHYGKRAGCFPTRTLKKILFGEREGWSQAPFRSRSELYSQTILYNYRSPEDVSSLHPDQAHLYPNALGASTIVDSSPGDHLIVARTKGFGTQPTVVMIKHLLRAFGENLCENSFPKIERIQGSWFSNRFDTPIDGIFLDRGISSIKISFRYLV